MASRTLPAPAGARHRAPASAPDWVVLCSGTGWVGGAHRQHALARELTVDHRVLFVDPPANLPGRRFVVRQVDERIWHATGTALLPLGRQVPPANRINRQVAASRLRRWLDGHGGRVRLVWLDEDLAVPITARLGAAAVVYDATDLDWTFTRRWNRWHLRGALADALRAADLVLASSAALPDRLPVAHRPPVVLPNGCDPQRFSPHGPVSRTVSGLPRPVLGYCGSIDTRAFDADLVAEVARRNPAWTFLLAGPATRTGRAPLAGLPNVHLTGPVDFAEVPALLRGCDVGLIPYRIGGLVDYVHPKKFYEYLALGLPVVATPLPTLRGMPGGHALLAADPPAFTGAVHEALRRAVDPAGAAARRAVALQHTWRHRGEQLRRLLSGLPR